MLDITTVLQSLINKINGKVIVIELAMILLFLLSTSSIVNNFLFISISIIGLSLFYAILQFIIEYRSINKKE